eukprot:TRINITY_DN27399_c0_g1_i1.p1 TRINITY_DN27399_c0_g1~~TRINITY_DN27399_c0_g1_i1.p1  ORF type:complete len:375 (-),score=63.58 TRINITY_DN27399_c0_g1_i1:91-1086(-)
MADTREPELQALGLADLTNESFRACPSCTFQIRGSSESISRSSDKILGHWTKHYVEVALLAERISASFKFFKCRSHSRTIDPHWCKVAVLKQLLEEADSVGHTVDFIIYLDTDITVAGQHHAWAKLTSQLRYFLTVPHFHVLDPLNDRTELMTFANASMLVGYGDACGSSNRGGIQNFFSTAMLILRSNSASREILSEWAQTWPRTNRLAPYFDQAGLNLLRERFPRDIAALASDLLLDAHVRESCLWHGPMTRKLVLDAWRANNLALQKSTGARDLSEIQLGRHREKGQISIAQLESIAGASLRAILQKTPEIVEEIIYDIPLMAALQPG